MLGHLQEDLSPRALAKGMKPADVVTLYEVAAPVIFERSGWTGLASIFRARHRNDKLKDVLTKAFNEDKLGDLERPVFIPVVALKRPEQQRHVPSGLFLSTVYRHFDRPKYEKYNSSDWSCVDALLATSAAPTYFPAHVARESEIGGYRLWDGGLVANSPAFALISELCRFRPINELEFNIVCLGTGYVPNHVVAGDWGILQSAQAVVDTMFDLHKGSTAYFMRMMFPDRVAVSIPC